ncbi:effector-associated constant component EACC1 [Streptomyces viridiviolaceus]
MEIDIAVGEGPSDVSSLRRWLMAEPGLMGHAVISVRTGTEQPGAMGSGLDVVNVVLSNSIALGSLLVAVATWRRSRPRAPHITLEREGVVVTLHGDSPEAVERVLREWSGTPGPEASRTEGSGE